MNISQLAVAIQPNYSDALLALGKLQYAQEQYEESAGNLAKVPETDKAALRGRFYRGLPSSIRAIL